MPYIDKIVDAINTTWQTGMLNRKAFQQGMFYSLAKQVTVTEDGREKPVPMIYAIYGKKEINPAVDDKYSFQVYHRINTQTFNFSNAGTQFGDGDSMISEITQMIAVVFADPERLGITQENLSFLMATGLPSNFGSIEMGNSELGQIRITPTSVNHNSQQVYSAEYGPGSYPLKPQSIYFSISYQIETHSTKTCVTCTDC